MRGAHSCHEALSRQVDVGQAQGDERPGRILRQAAVAHLAEAPHLLDDGEDMLASRAHLGLQSIEDALELCGHTAGSGPLTGPILRIRRL